MRLCLARRSCVARRTLPLHAPRQPNLLCERTVCASCSAIHQVPGPKPGVECREGVRGPMNETLAFSDCMSHTDPSRMQSTSRRSPPLADGTVTNRRTAVLACTAWPIVPLALASLTSSSDPTTILNSVLSGYGLPRLPGASGFKTLDDLDYDFTLEYPRSWVGRPNSLRSGVYISDFNTADKLTVEVLPLDPGADINEQEVIRLAVTSTIVPGFQQGQADDKLSVPSSRLIKQLPSRSTDGHSYLYLEFPSETITRSGYNIRRHNYSVAVVKRSNLFVCAASAHSNQLNKEKEELLRHIVNSFELRS